jgi:hypothetical protein
LGILRVLDFFDFGMVLILGLLYSWSRETPSSSSWSLFYLALLAYLVETHTHIQKKNNGNNSTPFRLGSDVREVDVRSGL